MEPIVNRGHRVLIRDFLIFQLKLVLDGLKDLVLLQVSLFAVLFDLLFGRRGRPLLFYNVLRMSERFDLWLNLYAPSQDAERNGDGLFGTSESGGSSLVGKLEELITGKVETLRSDRAGR